MKKVSAVLMFGFLLFVFHKGVKPAAVKGYHGSKAVASHLYHAAV